MTAGELLDELGLLDGDGAEDDAIKAALQQFFGPFGAADPPPNCTGMERAEVIALTAWSFTG